MPSPTVDPEEARPGGMSLVSFLLLSAWCGLLSGLLEVGATIVRKRAFDVNQFYWTTRHFVWLVPLVDLAIFVAAGMVLWIPIRVGGQRGRRWSARALCTLTLLAPFWAAFTRIYSVAGIILVLGASVRLVPMLEPYHGGLRRMVRLSLPFLVGLVLILAARIWLGDRQRMGAEAARPLPPPGSENVLLIVLDTVGAGHLSGYGYPRPTSPTLDELASLGIRFDRAQATSSWTLPSHASMFTGRWPHELSTGWFSPLDGSFPTLAEYLGSRGYATAGFVANTWYCGIDTGLARGFTEYRDYRFPGLTVFRTSVLIDRPLEGLQAVENFLEDRLDFDLFRPAFDSLWMLFKSGRKGAAEVSGEFLDWLGRRREPDRPFFAFLNYYDAHYPYDLQPRGIHRFGARRLEGPDARVVPDWLRIIGRGPSPHQVSLARDAYDDCIADLDEQLGRLIDQLERGKVLDHTWVIVVGDHGESFGEQPRMFWHGTSLYQPQVHVPLIVVPPKGGPPPRVVSETVSLRDLAPTVVSALGLETDAPFPGASLGRYWQGSSDPGTRESVSSARALSEVVPLDSFGPDPSLMLHKPRWPMASIAEAGWTYIRREGPVREELYHLPEDPQERRNVADDSETRPTLERLRETLDQFTSGPLTPERFRP